MTEDEEFEFRLRLEREQGKPAEKPKGQTPQEMRSEMIGQETANNPLTAVRNIGAGAVRGAGSIGATLLRVLPNALGGDTKAENDQRRKDMDGAFQSMGVDTDGYGYAGGKLAAEIAGTAGAGGGLAGLLSKIPGMATKAAPVIAAIQSGGMSVGGLKGAAGVGARAVGGGITGGASAAAVNPEDFGMGAALGAAAGPVVQGAVKLGKGTAGVVRNAMLPQESRLAQRLADTVGLPKDQLLSLLNKQGPQLIDGYQATVPQILQNPAISQLQRTLKTAGNDALGSAERTQQQQYMQTLNRVAPVDLTVQDAAARAGGAIEDFAAPARGEVSKKVSAAFDGVDPFEESGLMLPLDKMQKAADKYLGAGTFGTGSRAREAIAKANDVGLESLPAIKPLPQSTTGKGETLEQAVRRAGGLRGSSGELRDLGIRESGTTGMINNKSGQSADLLAEKMYERGFLPDADPATLYDALRNGAGRKLYAADFADAGFANRLEQSMGDMPGATTFAKAVPFQTVQNLRSSIGEAAEQASAKGANKEAAALRQMVGDIDGQINKAAAGNAGAGEYFPKDMADQYKAALQLHADKMARFETGPQVGMFRKGADGQAAVQGAEIPGKFYSGKRSQVEDMQAFKRLVGTDPQADTLTRELQRYATTEGANTATGAGNLSSKYGDWLASRSGANRELFDPGQNAALKAINDAIETGASAENLGRVTGSDTAQKLASLQSIGLLDNGMVNLLANRIPIVGNFTGPMLEGLRSTARGKQSDTLAGLLANPDSLSLALNKIKPSGGPQGELAKALLQYSGRSAPVIYAD